MVYLTCTRFNTETFEQNTSWRRTHNYNGCIYGTPVRVKESMLIGETMLVLEMQNDINKILGIGLVTNNLVLDKKPRIYEWGNYNRYIYKGNFHILREELTEYEESILGILDVLCFKGSRHLKRGSGITQMPSWITKNKHIDFISEIKNMFTNRFGE